VIEAAKASVDIASDKTLRVIIFNFCAPQKVGIIRG